MNHYFSNNQDLDHDFKEIKFTFANTSFIFFSDAGVFSREYIDYGSRVLIETAYKNKITGNCLDLGCGYGVISIILHKLLDVKFMGVDINSRAVDLAEKNAELNGCSIAYFVSDGFNNVKDKFDNILVNPPIRTGKDTIYKMFDDAYEHLNVPGVLWVVIRKQQGALSALKKLEEKYSCKVVNKDKGYWIIKANKY